LVPPEIGSVRDQISEIVDDLTGVSRDLQEISRGIHPAILSRGGLGPALKALARRSSVPVALRVGLDQRLPDSVEVAAYYVVAESLTNAAKHAQASEVWVDVDTDGANLRLSIRDDGIGGADSGRGSGLVGLTDRVDALGGHLQISSPIGSGTSLLSAIPL
jgi:signal transduction histidine kinase